MCSIQRRLSPVNLFLMVEYVRSILYISPRFNLSLTQSTKTMLCRTAQQKGMVGQRLEERVVAVGVLDISQCQSSLLTVRSLAKR